MSRTSSIARALASTSRAAVSPLHLSRRTLLGDAHLDGAKSDAATVDPRILEGMPNFLPKENMDRICDWQGGLWSRLQDETRNNPALFEVKQKWDRTGLEMTYLLSQSAKDSSMTLAFNYASLLLNNSYFLEGINGESQAQAVPPSFAGLEEKLQAYAEGMVGGGWLWLVQYAERGSPVDIIPTFAGGTLLVTNRVQRGRDDYPVYLTPENSGYDANSSPETSENSDADIRPRLRPSQPRAIARTPSDRPMPVAVLSLFEHAYVGPKYGVWNKADYARDWFRALNWNLVQRRATLSS